MFEFINNIITKKIYYTSTNNSYIFDTYIK